MKTILNYLGVLVIGITIGIVGSLIVRSKLATPIRKVITDTTTVIKYDTIRITEPYADVEIPLTIKVYPIAQVPTLLAIVDTMKIPYIVNGELIVPISQKYYRSPQYQAWVSGFSARLDSILVYSPIETHVITNTVRKTANNELFIDARLSYIYPDLLIGVNLRGEYIRNDQWGFFLETGLTSGVQTRPYGMFGISYRLYSKKW